MNLPRILTIQDISCVGQCSLTAALPILSASGVETCILPSAVLSTHTGGFSGYTFRDLTADMPDIAEHWQKARIRFDAVYSGYLGSARQIGYVQDIYHSLARDHARLFVDPAMADNGRLYSNFDRNFVEAMKPLCFSADVMLPNVTEACLLTDTPWQEQCDEAFAAELLKKLHARGAKTVILTGVSCEPHTTGVLVSEWGEVRHYRHKRIERMCHGTGDVFASAFVGACLRGFTPFAAARVAASFTLRSIENTPPDHWYGVYFESALPMLTELYSTEKLHFC